MSIMSLANHFIVASPSIKNPDFKQAVIYVCEHQDQGSVGLIINQPIQKSIDIVFNQLHIERPQGQQNHTPLLLGGPTQPERGFVIHRPFGHWHSSLLLIPDDVMITTSNDIIRAIARNEGPRDVLVTLGYVAWANKHLEDEIIKEDSWLVVPFKSELLYDVPFENRWEAAGLSIGVQMKSLITDAGHA